MRDYGKYSDEELAALSRSDENALECLIKRYKKAVISVVRQYFLVGGEEDDLVQEGTIGLVKAINTYNGKSSFKSYAFTCIKSGIISSVRSYTSVKNKPMSYYVSINADEENDKNPILKLDVSDPEEEYINEESVKEFIAEIKSALSEYEYDILQKYMQGYSYGEIAVDKKTTAKSVDNAIQRIKKKIVKLKNEGGKRG
ncbi:MAG: sigma-70 family RNA polymerase sigma factor [Clostridia bacterium]|nr:sigma-70 family RNA polymerase sigma factor [Clostridia bacterium]